jgi:hypothetical protein
VVAEIAEQADVSTVIDTGDTTYIGNRFENIFVDKIIEPFNDLGVDYVYVSGNHDTKTTVDEMKARGAIVLDCDVTQVGPYNIAGMLDPEDHIVLNTLGGKDCDPERAQALFEKQTALDSLVALSRQNGENIDFLAAHDHNMDRICEDVPSTDVVYHLAGHVHANRIWQEGDSGSYHFTIDDSSGSNRDWRDTLFGSGIGRPSNSISARIFFVDRYSKPGEHRVAKVCTVTIQPDSSVEVEELILE